MLGKIKNVLVGLFCFFMVSMEYLIVVISSDQGSTGMNRFLVVGLWAASVFFILKGKAVMTTIASTIVIIFFYRDAFFSAFTAMDEEMWGGIILTIILIGIIFKPKENSDRYITDVDERRENTRKSGKGCCPYCGSNSVQYYPLGIPHKEYDVDLDRDVIVTEGYPNYHCNNCGGEWS